MSLSDAIYRLVSDKNTLQRVIDNPSHIDNEFDLSGEDRGSLLSLLKSGSATQLLDSDNYESGAAGWSRTWWAEL